MIALEGVQFGYGARRVLDVPGDWLFIGYLCLGWPEAEEASPELERLGWEKRRPIAERLLRR